MKSFYEMLMILEGSQGLKARARRADWLTKRSQDLDDGGWGTGKWAGSKGDPDEEYEKLASDARQASFRSASSDLARQKRIGPNGTPHDAESKQVTDKMIDASAPSKKALDRIISGLAYKGDIDKLKKYVDLYPESEKNKESGDGAWIWNRILSGGLRSKSHSVVDYALDHIKNLENTKMALFSSFSDDEDTSMLEYVLDKTKIENEDIILSLITYALINGRMKHLEYLLERFPKLDLLKLRKIHAETRQWVYPVYPKFGTDWRDDEPSYEADHRRKKLSPILNYFNNYLIKRSWDDNPGAREAWRKSGS